MNRGPKTAFSQSEAGALMIAYETCYEELCRLQADSAASGDVLAARLQVRAARLGLLRGIKRLQDEVRVLEAARRRLAVEKSMLNVENRRLADIAVGERQRIRVEGVVR